MEPLWRLIHLLEPCSLALMATAVAVVWAAARRALSHEKQEELLRKRFERDSSCSDEPPPSTVLTLDGSLALVFPVAGSLSLLLMFYFFALVSQFMAIATAAVGVWSFAFFVSPLFAYMSTRYSFLSRNSRSQWLLVITCAVVLLLWLITGHWLLNNLLGISLCVTIVTHIRLPNIKVCTLLMSCLFVYDIFWVFFSERLFGANVMVSVAMQQASNPMHTVVQKLNLPGLTSITQKLEMPGKIIIPAGRGEMILGLGDMGIPGMFLALLLCFEYKRTHSSSSLDSHSKTTRRRSYSWYALVGYTVGLVFSGAAEILTHMAQPALLYLVPSTLGPVLFVAWRRRELLELWSGPLVSEKTKLLI